METISDQLGGCPLRYQRQCCDGKGYTIDVERGITQAKVCVCVNECELCQGSNLIVIDGESRACRQPIPGEIIRGINRAKIPARFASASRRKFKNYSGNIGKKLEELWKWLDEFRISSTSRGLLLSGPVGIGKTYLLVVIAKELIARKINVRFIDFFQLLADLRDGFTRDRSESEVLDPLIDVEALIIDEMGKARNSDWEQRILDQLIMGRYNQNRVIIASTNYRITAPNYLSRNEYQTRLDESPTSKSQSSFNTEELQNLIGNRSFSRIVETSHLIELIGDNYREVIAQRYHA